MQPHNYRDIPFVADTRDPWITYHPAPESVDRGTEDDLPRRQKQLRPNINLVAARQKPMRRHQRREVK